MFQSSRRNSSLVLLVVVAVGLAGCKKEIPRIEEVNRLKPIAILYGRYLAQNRGRPPAKEEHFKKFVETHGNEVLSQFQVSNVDELLVSSRDSQPFVIMYGRMPTSRIVAYERQGLNGMRWAANDVGQVEEMPEETLRQMVPDFQ